MHGSDITGIVHVIFKTHLDVGFTDLARNVVARYFDELIPAAIETARSFRRSNGADRFIWTVGSWLIYEYLEQAGPGKRARLEKAIEAGDIVWHGIPFTMHSELMEPSLFLRGLKLSQDLDKRFGRTTIAGKMTDVPGHTRGIVPLLAGAGIEFLHIGVNEASMVPDVPPVFVWRDPSGAEITVMYHHSYGSTMIVPGLPDCISIAHTKDNRGPQDVEEINAIYSSLREEFPSATVTGSTLNEFAVALSSVRRSLPVVTSEIGDTWIHGAGSDPWKVSRFRELSRLYKGWISADPGSVEDPAIESFSRKLLLVAEHTWGLDDKTYLGDYEHYTQAAFESVASSPAFLRMRESWDEQRRYITDAVEALGRSPRRKKAEKRLSLIAPHKCPLETLKPVELGALEVRTENFAVRLDPETGAFLRLRDLQANHEWADASHRLGIFAQHSYSHEDYERFLGRYITSEEEWARLDFGKPGLENAGVESSVVPITVGESRYGYDGSAHTVALRLIPGPGDIDRYGGPPAVLLRISISEDTPRIEYDLQWFDKPAGRLPQAIWFSFIPLQSTRASWRIRKLGSTVSPLDVVSNGSRTFHGVQDYLECRDDRRIMRLETLDAPLVAAGRPRLLDFDNSLPQMEHGIHFNLYNNVWGTNFPSWYEGDARFRFVLSLDPMDLR